MGTTVTGIQTAITMHTLVMASLMITGGKIGQIWGRKRAFANLILCLTLRPALHPGGQSCRRAGAVTMQAHARNDLDRAEHRHIIHTAGTADPATP